MKAAVLSDHDKPLSIQEVDAPLPRDKEKLVVMHAGALNHRDVWIMKGQYPGIKFPSILGSDGSGICDGEEVIIQPGFNWGSDQNFQDLHYHILGLPRDGTFAQMMSVPSENIFPKPEHLSFFEAAALPLAGLTAYRSIFSKGGIDASSNVLISGIGGGVALFAMQFAIKAGARVYVTSSKQEKIDKAISMGALGGVLYNQEKWSKQMGELSKGIDLVIDGAGGPGFNELLKCCNPGAKMVVYGGTAGSMKVSPQLLFWKQIQINGSTMGSPMDFQNMLNFINLHQIVPVIDSVYKLTNINKAIERMASGQQFGKILINCSNL